MYYNKRLHPRQYQYVEHKTGCVLREFAETPPSSSSSSPLAQKITHYSSMSSLDSSSNTTNRSTIASRSRRHTSGSSSNRASTTNLTAPAAKRDYFRPMAAAELRTPLPAPPSASSAVADSDDSIGRKSSSVSTTSRKTSESSLKMVSFSSDCVDREGYDSPERIIANLFPESVRPSVKGNRNVLGGGTLRKGSVDSYLSAPPTRSVIVQRRRQPDESSYKRKSSIYRPDSLQSIERDFLNLKYDVWVGCGLYIFVYYIFRFFF